MKIEYRKTKDDGIIQVTTSDERHYFDEKRNIAVPSSTWIASFYPKGIQFYKWLAQQGWDEAQAIKESAGNKGSKIHQAVEYLETQGELRIEDKFLNSSTGNYEDLTVDEWEAIMSFVDWRKEFNPELIMSEQVVWFESETMKYAGTLDRVYKIGDKLILVDFKTGQSIWTESEIQVSSYGPALLKSKGVAVDGLAILQLGYKKNKRGWKFTELQNRWELFEHAYAIWKHENPDDRIRQKDYPQVLKVEKAIPPVPEPIVEPKKIKKPRKVKAVKKSKKTRKVK